MVADIVDDRLLVVVILELVGDTVADVVEVRIELEVVEVVGRKVVVVVVLLLVVEHVVGISIQEHKVEITLTACCCNFDQAEALASSELDIKEDVVVIVVVLLVVVVVVVVSEGLVEEACRLTFCADVHETGYAAEHRARAIG